MFFFQNYDTKQYIHHYVYRNMGEKHYKWWLECAKCDTWIIKSQDEEVCRKGVIEHYRSFGHIAIPSRILKN